jgi:hypothetical protein
MQQWIAWKRPWNNILAKQPKVITIPCYIRSLQILRGLLFTTVYTVSRHHCNPINNSVSKGLLEKFIQKNAPKYARHLSIIKIL